MISQTRAVFDAYAANGGTYEEITVPDCGHSAHLENPDIVRSALVDLVGSDKRG